VLLPYVWLSLAIVWLWVPPQVSGRTPWSRFGVSAAWLALAIVHALAVSILSTAGIVAIAVFGLLCFAYWHQRSPPVDAVLTTGTILFSLALMAHVVPGFSNTLIVRDAVLSPGAVPYTLFLNFDKGQIGLFLLAFGPPLIASRADWTAMLKTTLPAALALIVLLMLCALLIGQVRFGPKRPDFLPIWLWSNLLFTSAAEEVLFRGVIQRRLQGAASTGTSRRAIAGLIAAAIIFGAAHYAGGLWSVVLATIAGIGYGWVFWRTNRIEASILTHFFVNTAHILGFTYPALS
jgi:membrane protease YdiL (CAAX protease family)